jgi:5-formyltetrahydrofolate cyclo-ligase
MLAIEFPGWSALKPGTLGIPAPVSDRAFEGRVDVVITPGVGFTAAGDRLGMGKGYYDRWFAAHDYGLSVAICFECQLVAELPVSETDVPVDLIVTEQRVIRTAR